MIIIDFQYGSLGFPFMNPHTHQPSVQSHHCNAPNSTAQNFLISLKSNLARKKNLDFFVHNIVSVEYILKKLECPGQN